MKGTARIPAPTVVPATRAADPKTSPGVCFIPSSKVENSLPPVGLLVSDTSTCEATSSLLLVTGKEPDTSKFVLGREGQGAGRLPFSPALLHAKALVSAYTVVSEVCRFSFWLVS